MKPVALVLSGLALALATWRPGPPRLMWNATASVPVGLYRLEPVQTLKIDDLVVFNPPAPVAAMLDERGWLPGGVPLVKPIAALPGQRVCRHGLIVWIDGRARARSLARDRHGRPLPGWSGCRVLALDEVMPLASAPGSFDGRYLGPIRRETVIAVARPIWTSRRTARP